MFIQVFFVEACRFGSTGRQNYQTRLTQMIANMYFIYLSVSPYFLIDHKFKYLKYVNKLNILINYKLYKRIVLHEYLRIDVDLLIRNLISPLHDLRYCSGYPDDLRHIIQIFKTADKMIYTIEALDRRC